MYENVLDSNIMYMCGDHMYDYMKQSRPNRFTDKINHACKTSDNYPICMVDSALNCDCWCHRRSISCFEKIDKQIKYEENLKIWRTGSGETVSYDQHTS